MINVGDSCFGVGEEYFEYEDFEEALEAKWDQADPSEKMITIFEGEVSQETFFDDEYDAEINRVVNVKERHFQVLKEAKYFDMVNFKEVSRSNNNEND